MYYEYICQLKYAASKKVNGLEIGAFFYGCSA